MSAGSRSPLARIGSRTDRLGVCRNSRNASAAKFASSADRVSSRLGVPPLPRLEYRSVSASSLRPPSQRENARSLTVSALNREKLPFCWLLRCRNWQAHWSLLPRTARDEKAREYLGTFELIRSLLPAGDDSPAIVICRPHAKTAS